MKLFVHDHPFTTCDMDNPLRRIVPGSSLPGSASDYFSFLSVGMFSFIVLFASVFSGMAIVFDRQAGFLKKMLVTS